MIQSANGVISTEQPESMHVHTGFSRTDDMGQTVRVTCSVAYHQHFDGEGQWMTCDDAWKYSGNHRGRVLKNSGHAPQEGATVMPLNLPR